jgi:hypothetical protein
MTAMMCPKNSEPITNNLSAHVHASDARKDVLNKKKSGGPQLAS